VKNVVDVSKKDPAPDTNKITSIQNEQNMPQGPNPSETTDNAGSPQVEESSDAPDVLDLLTSFQKMRREEQELLEIKQTLLERQQDLQSKLVKEIDKKKMVIDDLKSEIPAIQNRCKQLGQVLGVDIYK
jgi:hypothetical protein